MTDTELNIKIADHVGTGHLRWFWFFKFRWGNKGEWEHYTCGRNKERAEQTRGDFMAAGDQVTELELREVIEQIPDYCNDLNAMAEAEKCLTRAQKCTYADLLVELCGGAYFRLITATARQRAEAFARVFNLI